MSLTGDIESARIAGYQSALQDVAKMLMTRDGDEEVASFLTRAITDAELANRFSKFWFEGIYS